MTSVLRQIGVLTRPHGLRGEIKVRPETDDPARFESLDSVFIGRDEDDTTAYRVLSVRYQTIRSGIAVVLTLEGIDDRDDAGRLSGLLVWADEADLPPLAEGEVFVSDLVGLDVLDDTGSTVGRVTDVLDLPAQPVLVIMRTDGREALVPFVPDLIEGVDERGIAVRRVEGLLDPDEQEEG